MAVYGPYISADSSTRSLIDRVRAFSKNSLAGNLVVWVGVVATIATAAKLMLPAYLLSPSTPVLTSIMVLAATAGLLACLYCFSFFILTRQFNALLLAMAFSTMGCGTVLQSILDIKYSMQNSQGWLLTASWVLSGVLFTGAAYVTKPWKSVNRRQAVAQAIFAACMVAAFPAVAIPYVYNDLLIMTLEVNTSSLYWSAIGSLVSASALILLVYAIFGHYRRARMHHDRMSGLLCYFLVPYGMGIMCTSATLIRFDDWWAVGQLLASGAWAVFIIVGSIENAFAHREAAERLAELETLHDVSWSLVGAGAFSEMLDTLASTLKERLHASIAVIYLADETRERLVVAAVSGPDEYPVGVGNQYQTTSANKWPGFHSGHTVKALFSAQTQIVRDVFIDVEFVPWKYIATDDGCAVSLPLIHQGTAIGVVNIYFTQWRQVTRQRLKLLTTVAAAATPAIKNARHRDEDQGRVVSADELDAAA